MHVTHRLDLLYMYTKYQNISKGIKVIERTSSPLKCFFKGDNSKGQQGRATMLHRTHHHDLIYMPTKYNQNISKGIKVIERTSFFQGQMDAWVRQADHFIPQTLSVGG